MREGIVVFSCRMRGICSNEQPPPTGGLTCEFEFFTFHEISIGVEQICYVSSENG